MDGNKSLEELKAELEGLEAARESEEDGNKKGALTRKINALKEAIESEGKTVLIRAKSTRKPGSYRRAGLPFTNEFQDYEVTEEQLVILEADPNIRLEQK